MKIVILKNNEMIITRKEYVDMLVKISELEAKAKIVDYLSINDIRTLFNLPRINEDDTK